MNYTEQVQRLLTDKEAELDRVKEEVKALRKAVKTGLIPFRLLDQAANSTPSKGQQRKHGKQKHFPVGIYEGMSIKDAIKAHLTGNGPANIAAIARDIFGQDPPSHDLIKAVQNGIHNHPAIFKKESKGMWTINTEEPE